MNRSAALEEILSLRQRVLRKNLPELSPRFDGDELPSTRHFGTFLEDRAVACLTVLVSLWEKEPAYQLRGMAVDPSLKQSGLGRNLLEFAVKEMHRESDVRLWWCNARVSALGFYEKLGWKIVSEEFDIPRIGPHRKMVFRG